MHSLNRATLFGNVGGDPEIRNTTNGNCVANFSLATTEKWKDKDGQIQERTEWHRCVAFGRLGEIIGEYVKKGAKLYVEGRIRTEQYTDNAGVERWSTKINVDDIIMAGGRRESSDDRSGGSSSERPSRPPMRQESSPRREAPPARETNFADDFADDDIPF